MNNKILTLPNILTIFRLLLVPFFVVFFLLGYKTTAFTIFVMASITDAVDGYLARKLNAISNIGKVLDPLADKSLRIAAIIVFFIKGVLPLWILIVMAVFDLTLVITSAILYNKKYVVYSNVYGKLAGFFSFVAVILCFFYTDVTPFHIYAMGISLVLVLVSILSYAKKVILNKDNILFKK